MVFVDVNDDLQVVSGGFGLFRTPDESETTTDVPRAQTNGYTSLRYIYLYIFARRREQWQFTTLVVLTGKPRTIVYEVLLRNASLQPASCATEQAFSGHAVADRLQTTA